MNARTNTALEHQGKRIFTFEPSEYQAEFAKNGFVLIKDGVDPDFLAVAIEQAEKQRSNDKDMDNWFFKGKKRQYLYDFDEWDFYQSGLITLAQTAGLTGDKVTLCERHIKVYEADAKAHVPPHKDRLAAQLTVGIPLFIPEETYIVLWPNDQRTTNCLNTTALWRNSLDEENLPENMLKNIEPVKVYAEPGDVVMFLGSSIYHERENPANTRILYLKLNDMNLDPIGEDPSTFITQKTSQEILDTIDNENLLDCFVEVSPRLDKISRHYTRLNWKEVIQAYVADEKEFTLSEIEYGIFKAVENNMTVRELIFKLSTTEVEQVNYIPMIRRLACLKGLNIMRPQHTQMLKSHKRR